MRRRDVLVGIYARRYGTRAADGRSITEHDATTDEELAFAMGLLCHAAADAFAHTLVNRYAGDVFDLKVNQTASRRHVMIETFISQLAPPLNSPQPDASDSYRKSLINNGRLAIPETFVREVAEPYVPLIAGLRARLREALNNKGIVGQIENFAVQLSAAVFAGVNLTSEGAEEVRKTAEQIHDITDATGPSIEQSDISERHSELAGRVMIRTQACGKLWIFALHHRDARVGGSGV